MNIFVHNRSFFENWRGKKMERQLFRDNRIISINSVSSPAEQPPFSQEFLESDNLLVLYFDDVNEGEANAMTPEQAKQIVDFVHSDDDRSLIIHCTAGVSRSGAVGDVLNWYFNRYITDNRPDYHLNESMNRKIIPNSHVRRLLLAELQNRHESLREMVKTIRKRELSKQLKYLLSGVYAEKSFPHPVVEEQLKNIDCIMFSENVIGGNPKAVKYAKNKFLYSRCGVTCYNGNILVADIRGDGKMRQIFEQMLKLATPEKYAVKGENVAEFFAPFREHFKSRLYKYSKRFLHLWENDPAQSVIFLLAELQFDDFGMMHKHAVWAHTKKFDALCEALPKENSAE